MRKIERERVERVARIYPSSKEASLALGIAPGSFSRLCRLYGIETPKNRRQNRRNF
jgi:hypothetical protein